MLLMARRSLSWRRTWVAFLALVTLAWVDPVLASDVVPSGYAYEVAPENLGPYADATGTLLTNGTLPSCAWPASCDYTEYVGWNGTGPTITFDFPEDVTVEAIALTVADSDGSAGVRSPASLTVNLGDSQQILALPNLEGTGVRRILIPLDTTVTGRVFTLHLRRSDLPSSSWIMLAEVEFIEAAEATPDGTSEAAKEPTFFASSTAVIGPAAGTDVVKANNADAMADGTSWVGDVAPTTGDTAIFDATFDNTVGFGTGDPLSWLGMEVTGGTSTIDIRNGNLDNWVGLGAGGLIMSSASARTVYVNSLQQQADHAWSVATGNNLFVGYSPLIDAAEGTGRFEQANGSVLSLDGGGAISISMTTAAIRLGDTSAFTGSLNTNGTDLALVADTAESITFGGTLSGTTTIAKSGDGTYELPGASFGSSVDVSAGTLVLSGANTFSSSELTKAGAGSLLVTGANAYTGITEVSAGTLQVGNGGTAGSIGSGNITLRPDATLAFNRSDDVSLGNQWNGFTGGGTRTIRNDGSGLVALLGSSSNIGSNDTGETLVLSGSGSGLVEQSFASGGADLGIRKEGSGTWTFTSDSNGYSGPTTISAGTLQIGNGGSTGTIGTGDLELSAGVTLAFNRTAPLTVANDWISFDDGGIRTLRNDGTGKITLNGGNIGLSSGTTTLALTGSGDGEIAQSIAAGGAEISIAKEGAGTWTLSNAATNYSGATTITAGTLEVTGLIGAGTYAQAIANDGELHINTASDQTLSGDISGSGLLRKSAAGKLTLTGANAYTGGTVLAGGMLVLGSADALGATGTVTLTGGTLQFSASNTTDYSARFATVDNQAFNLDTNGQAVTVATPLTSSGGSLTKSGAGVLTLSAANAYDGATTVNAGTLRVVDGGLIGTGEISIPDGTLEFTWSGDTSLSNQLFVKGTGSSPALLNNGTGLLTIQPGTSTNIQVDNGETFTVGGSGDVVIEKSIASGAGASLLTKVGAGTVILTSPLNNWSGGTTISEGVLQVGDGTSNGTIGSGTITLTNGRLAFNRPDPYTISETLAAFQANTTPGIENNGAGILTFEVTNLGFSASGITLALGGSGAGIVDGPIANGGAAANLLKDGSGTWTLGDVNTNYSGVTTINGGTLEITGRLGKGAYGQPIFNEGTLHFNSASPQTLSGVISGAGTLEKSGSGTLSLTDVNTYSGDTTINAGTLRIGAGGSLGGGAYAGTISNDGILDFATSANQTLAGSLSGSGDLIKGGSGTLTIAGEFALTGDISIPDGTLEFTRSGDTSLPNQLFVKGTGSSPALLNNGAGHLTIQTGTSTNIQVDNGETFTVGGSGDVVIEKSIASGAGASLLTKVGAGTVILTSPLNNWSGGTTISEGVLQVGDGTSDGTIGSGTITITNGRLAFNRPNPYTIAETIATFQDGTTPGIENNGAGLLTVNASNLGFSVGASGITLDLGGTGDGLMDGPIAVGGAAANVLKDGTGTWTFDDVDTNYSGMTTVAAGTLEITGRLGKGSYAQPIANDATLWFNSASAQTLAGSITGSGTLQKSNTGTLSLTGANSFTGGLHVQGGTVTLGTTGSLAPTLTATIDAGTLDVANRTQTLAGVTGAGGAVNLGPSGTLNISNATADTYGGAFQGTGALVKQGAGTLTLTGASSHTGSTTIEQGTLALLGSLNAATVTVQGAGTLAGTGSIAGDVTIASGGRVAPGSSVGVLTQGDTTFATGATYEAEIDTSASTASGADLLIVDGNLTVRTGATLSITDLAASSTSLPGGTTFALINYTGTWNGGVFTLDGQPLANGTRFTMAGQVWEITYDYAYDTANPTTTQPANFQAQHLPASGTQRFVAITVISATSLELTASTLSATEGSTITFEATLMAGGAPVPQAGVTIDWTTTLQGATFGQASTTTNAQGVAQASLDTSQASSGTVTAASGSLSPASVTIDVFSNDASVTTSTITVAPTALQVGSGSSATVTIQPKNALGMNVDVQGLNLAFEALGAGQGTLTTPTYQAGGAYTATYTVGSTAGNIVLTPTLDGAPFDATAAINVVTNLRTGVQVLDGTSGGAVSDDSFSTDGDLTVGQAFFLDYLIVGGGGGGGYAVTYSAGGGGGGQVVAGATSIGGGSNDSGPVVVGDGGNGATSKVTGGSGGTSSWNSITALGGGGGGSGDRDSAQALPSGSPAFTGGGGGGSYSGTASNGAGGTGFSGGNGQWNGSSSNLQGGGGGAGAGGNGTGGSGTSAEGSAEFVGNGGTGVSSSITGTSLGYGGGGGGGKRSGTAGSGVDGGGSGATNGNGSNGAANRGGGGGGAGGTGNGGDGGSGVVMLRFRGGGNDIDFTGGTIEAMSGAFEGYSLVRYTAVGTHTFNVDFDNRLNTTLTEPISGSGTFTYDGPGTLILTADSSYVGDTTISGGILQVGDGGTSGSLGAGDITNNGTLVFYRSHTSTVPGTISGSGTVIQQGGGSLDLDGGSHSAGSWSLVSGSIDNGTLAAGDFDFESGSVSAILASSGAFTKTGFGRVVLSAANTYSGTTTISEGTLAVNGNQSGATGAVSVADGATLAGAGTVGGAVSLASGATVNAGDGVGTMATSSSVTFAGGSNLNWQITDATGAAGTDWDLLAIGGELDINASTVNPIQINVWSVLANGEDGAVTNFNPTLNAYSWTIATAAGGISGFDAAYFEVNTGATNGTGGLVSPYSVDGFTVSVDGNDLVLSYSPPVMQTLNGTIGGVVSTNYTTNTSASSLTLDLGLFVDYLIVGGGGGGGRAYIAYSAGGGGGGEVLQGANRSLSNMSYSITVGNGGSGSGSTRSAGGKGGSSAFDGLTARGGGGGGSGEANHDAFTNPTGSVEDAYTGGGGGGTYNSNRTLGASGVEGRDGGDGRFHNTQGAGQAGGGGGGAGGAGGDPTTTVPSVAGAGGIGVASSITGVSRQYGGGGGGGSRQGTPGSGTDGGGAGGKGNTTQAASLGSPGQANTGGGGGGGGSSSHDANFGKGGSGGSGIVVLRYPGESLGSIGGTVTSFVGDGIIGESGVTYQVHSFTSSGAFDLSVVTFDEVLSATLAGDVVGSGDLILDTEGTLTLSGVKSHEGGIEVRDGTFALTASGDVSSSSDILINADGALAGSGILPTAVIAGRHEPGGSSTADTGAYTPGDGAGVQVIQGDVSYDATSTLKIDLTRASDAPTDRGTAYDGVDVTGMTTIQTGAQLDVQTLSPLDWTSPFWNVDRAWLVISSGDVTGSFTLGTIHDDANGVSFGTVTGREHDFFELSPSDDGIHLRFRAATPSLDASTITSEQTSLPPDGMTSTTLTVTLRNAAGEALTVSAGDVQLSLNGPGSLGPVSNQGDGTYTAMYTAGSVPGEVSFSATLDGQPLTQTHTILISSQRLYRPVTSGSWSTVAWQFSLDSLDTPGGPSWSDVNIMPSSLGQRDVLVVPAGVALTSDVPVTLHHVRADGDVTMADTWTVSPTSARPQDAALSMTNVTVSSTGSLTVVTGGVTLDVIGDWTVHGTFSASDAHVRFVGTTLQTLTGDVTFHDLTIDNPQGVQAGSDFTVNGTLHLASSKPNAGRGALELVRDYGDYANVATPLQDLTTTGTQPHDFLDAYVLTMGPDATTTGPGDVTGKVRRDVLTTGLTYTFGSGITTITFTGDQADLPTALEFWITVGSDRGVHPNKPDTVQRLYQILREGGNPATQFDLRLRYLPTESNGLTPGNLVLWDHHIPYKTQNTPHPHGRTAFDTTAGWVGLSGHSLYYLTEPMDESVVTGGSYTPVASQTDTKYWMFAPAVTSANTWLGAAGGGQGDDWNNPSNWSGGAVPSSSDDVVVPPTTTANPSPILPTTPGADVATLVIEDGGTLVGGDGTLTVHGGVTTAGGTGSWINNGTFDPGTSTVRFDDPTPGETITVVGDTPFHRLEVTSGTTLQAGQDAVIEIRDTFDVQGTGEVDFETNDNTLRFRGVGPIVIPSAVDVVRRLEIDSTGVVHADHPLSVLDELVLLDGTLSATDLTYLGAEPISQTDGTFEGTLKQSVPGGNPVTLTYPLTLSGSDYTLTVTFTPPAGQTTSIAADVGPCPVNTTTSAGIDPGRTIDVCWNLLATPDTGISNVDVTFTFPSEATLDGDALTVRQSGDGTTWGGPQATTRATAPSDDPWTLTATGLDGFGTFAIGAATGGTIRLDGAGTLVAGQESGAYVARLVDAYGQPAYAGADTTIKVRVSPSDGTVTITPSPSDVIPSGGDRATFTLVATTVGGFDLTASASDANFTPSQPLNVQAVPAAPSALSMATQPSTGDASGATLANQPVLLVQDANGNTVTSDSTTVVTVTVSETGVVLSGTTSVTAVEGVVSFTDLALTGQASVPYTLRFDATGLTGVSATPITLTAGVATQVVIVTQPAGGFSGGTLTTQPVLEVRDAQGNRVSNDDATAITATVSGDGTLGGTVTVTATDGTVSFTDVTVAGTVGTPYQLTFTSTTFASVSSEPFTISAGDATSLAIVTQPTGGRSGQLLATQPVLHLLDAQGNHATQDDATLVTVSVSGTDGVLGGTTNLQVSGGVVTFTDLTLAGTVTTPYELQFSATDVTTITSSSTTVEPGLPAKLILDTQPTAGPNGATLTTQPVLSIRDAQGNVVTQDDTTLVTVTVSETGGTLGGTTTISANDGVATFTNLTLAGGNGETYTLVFTATSLTGTTAPPIALTLIQLGGDEDGTYDVVLSGTDPVVKTGDGTLTLTGDNSGHMGGITIGGGTIAIDGPDNLGSGPVTFSGTDTQLDVTAPDARTLDNDVTLGTPGPFSIGKTPSGGLDLTGTINGGGPGATFLLTPGAPDGGGTTGITLSGDNTFEADVTLDDGYLSLAHPNALGDPTNPLTLASAPNPDGNLRFVTPTDLPNPIVLSGTDGNQPIANDAGADVTLSGPITGGGGLTKTGDGTLTLTGDNDYEGTTVIDGGTLRIGNGGNTGYLGGTGPIQNDGTLEVNRSGDVTVDRPISGTGGIMQSGPGTLTLSGTNTYTGGTNLNGGILILGSPDALGDEGPIRFGGGTLRFQPDVTTDLSERFSDEPNQAIDVDLSGVDVTFAADLTSVGGTITKRGDGTLTLTGTNGYDGGTTIDEGELVAVGPDALGSGPVDFPGDGTLTISGGDVTLVNDVQIGSGDGSVTFTTPGDGIVTIDGTVNATGADTTLRITAGPDGGPYGEINLTQPNPLGGALIVDRGTLRLSHEDAAGDATIRLDAEDVDQGSGLALDDGITIDNVVTVSATQGLRIDGGDARLEGPIQGTGGIQKTGDGTLTLAGPGSYAGPTLVTGGTLLIDGDHTSVTGETTVEDGGTIGGTGTLGGTLDVAEGGTLDAGSTVGILTTQADVTLNPGSTFRWNLTTQSDRDRGTTYDALDMPTGGTLDVRDGVTSELAFGGDVDFTHAFWRTPRNWKVIDGTGTTITTGSDTIFTVNAKPDGKGRSVSDVPWLVDADFAWVVSGGDVYLTFTPNLGTDAPQLGGDLTGIVQENASPIATGTVTMVGTPDVVTFVSISDHVGAYGTFSLTDAGAWTYRLDDTHPTVDALAATMSLTDTFTLTASDATTGSIEVTILGFDDPTATLTHLVDGTTTPAVQRGTGARTTDTQPELSGAAPTSRTVRITVSRVDVTPTITEHDVTLSSTSAGTWTFTPTSALLAGEYVATARATSDAPGAYAPESEPFAFTILPTTFVTADTLLWVSDDTGASDADLVTQDATLTFHGRVPSDTDVWFHLQDVSSTTLWQTTVPSLSMTDDSLNAGKDVWMLDATHVSLSDGLYTVTVQPQRSGVSVGDAIIRTVVIDREEPTEENGAPGSSIEGAAGDRTAPTFTGRYDPVSTHRLTVIVNDTIFERILSPTSVTTSPALYGPRQRSTDGERPALAFAPLGATTWSTMTREPEAVLSVSDGAWRLVLPVVLLAEDDAYDVTVVAEDLAGNVASDVKSFDLSEDDPTQPGTPGTPGTPGNPDEDGPSEPPPPTPTVDVLVTNDTTPEVTGTATISAGGSLRIMLDGASYDEANEHLTRNGNRWRLQVPNDVPLDDGVYDVQVTAANAMGGSTRDATRDELTIDTVPPQSPTVDAGYFEIPRPTIRGRVNVASDEVLIVSIDGEAYPYGASDLVERAFGRMEPATLDAMGQREAIGILLVDADAGTWQLPMPRHLLDGTYDVIAVTIDPAGNMALDETQDEIQVFLPPPSVPTVHALTTIDATPEVTGTSRLRDGIDTFTVTVNGVTYDLADGILTHDSASERWALPIPEGDALPIGMYDVIARVESWGVKSATDVTRDELKVLVEMDPVLLDHDRGVMGRVFIDHDFDGAFGSNDVPLAGAILTLADGTTVTTSEDGRYLFPEVPLDARIIALLPSSVPGYQPADGFVRSLVGYGPFIVDLPLVPTGDERDDLLILDGAGTLRLGVAEERLDARLRATLRTELAGTDLDLAVGVAWRPDGTFESLLLPIDRADAPRGVWRLVGTDGVEQPVVSEDGVAFTLTGNRFRVAYQYAEMSAPGIGARVPGTALQVDLTPSAAFRFAAYGGLVRSGVVEETFDVAGLRRVTLSQVPTVGSLVLEVTLGDESWTLVPRQDYLRDGANVIILDPIVGYDDEGEGPILTARYVPLDAERSDVVLGAGVAADLGFVEVEAGVAYDERFRAVVNLATTLPGGGAGASLRLGENGLEAVQGSATLGAAWGDTRADLELGLDEENRITSNASLVSDWSGGGVKLELATLADQLGVSSLTLQQRLGLLTASGTLEFDPVVGVAGDVSLSGELLEDHSPLIARLGGAVGYRGDVGVRGALTLDAGISSSDAPIGVEVRSALGYDAVNGFLPTLGVHVDTFVADAVRLGLSQSVFGDRATRAALQVQRDGLEGVADVRYDWRDAAWRANVEAGGDFGPVRLDLAHVRTLSDDGVKVGTTLAATSQIDPAGGTSVGGSLRFGDGTVQGEVVANRTEGDVDMEVSFQVDPSAGPGRLALGVATPWNLGNGFEADVFGAVTLAASGSELRGGATLRYASDGVEADVGIDGATGLGSAGGRLNVTGGLLGRNDLFAAVADIDLRIVPTFEGTFGGAFRVDVPSGTTATVPGARFAPRGVIGYLDGDVAAGATTMTVGVGTQVEVTTSLSDGLSVRPSVAFRATWNDPLRPFAVQPRLGVVQEFDLLGIQASAALYGQFLTRPAVGTFYTSASAELRIMPVDGVALLFGYDTGETLLAPRGGGFRIGLEGHGIMRW